MPSSTWCLNPQTHMLAPATARQDGTQVTRRPGLSLRGWRAGLQLALVLRLIVVPLRLRDQAIGTHCPFFVPLDPNGLGSPPGPVFVPVQIHRKIAWLPSPRTSSVFTTMSGN